MAGRPMQTKPKRLLLYKIIAVLFAAFLFLMPDNINAMPDMDMRVLVTTLGLDEAAGQIQTVAQIIVPVAGGGSTGNNQVADGKGKSVSEALNNLSLGLGRKAELGQCGMVIIGNKIAASDNLLDALTYLMSSGIVSPGASLVYCDGQEVNEFMQNANELGEKTGAGLNNFIMYSKEGTHVSTLTLLEFLSNLSAESAATYIPCVTIEQGQQKEGGGGKEPSSDGEQSSGGEQGSGAQGGAQPKAKIRSADTVGVFKDGKLVTVLAGYQTRGITWVDRNSKDGLVHLDSFDFNGEDYGAVPAQLKHKRLQTKVHFENGLPVFTFRLKAYLQLEDKHILDSKPGNKKDIQAALADAFANKIMNEIDKSVEASKLLGADYLQLKTQFHRMRLKELRQYEQRDDADFLSDVTVRYDIHCRVK